MAYYEKIEDIDKRIQNYYDTKKPNVGLGVVIKNYTTNYDLEYVNSGYTTGWNVEPVMNMFDKGNRVIAKGYAGGLMWDRHAGGEAGKQFNTLV